MPYDPAYEITTKALHPDPLAYQPMPARAVMLPQEIPPGVQLVTLPGGQRALAYVQPPAHTPPPAPAAAQPVPAWAKTTALLAPTVGFGIAAGGIGLSYAAPGLIAMSHALWAAGAFLVAAVIGVPALIGGARRRSAGPTQITQNITATGLFGRANGTINHH
ncbi:hypothetical protein CG740_15480 [Streptomyces sp. CB01201]|uniref:hypothetical protein n=1 Tax=Streptomyces sp. CB01201 TaxID=2020324 RepID=UPI000C2709A2|nr:hypothetical protein CG740_15480 [Streptomyces sp. CB01201]